MRPKMSQTLQALRSLTRNQKSPTILLQHVRLFRELSHLFSRSTNHRSHCLLLMFPNCESENYIEATPDWSYFSNLARAHTHTHRVVAAKITETQNSRWHIVACVWLLTPDPNVHWPGSHCPGATVAHDLQFSAQAAQIQIIFVKSSQRIGRPIQLTGNDKCHTYQN